jgi:hypothetical protein
MRAAPAIAIGLTLPLSACGGSDTEVLTTSGTVSAPGAAIAAAAQKTLDSGTARVKVTIEHTTSDAHWGIEAGERDSSVGWIDFENYLVAIGDPPTSIFERTTLYFKEDEQPDARWRKHDFGRMSADDASLFVLRRYDPVHLLKLIASVDDFGLVPNLVGEERIRGRATTHYDVSIENEALARALMPGITYEEWNESRAYPEPIQTYAPLDAWVGADGRLYRVAYDWAVFESLFGERTVVDLYDFGADVEIELPAPDEVVSG